MTDFAKLAQLPPMNAKEVCERLGIGHETWAQRKRIGWHLQFEVRRPMGQRRYSRVLVERYANPSAPFGGAQS